MKRRISGSSIGINAVRNTVVEMTAGATEMAMHGKEWQRMTATKAADRMMMGEKRHG